ncbi:cupin domain-containing protein [Promethearchaeum syntrophicum]|uniref:Cupin domain-containing protein n=1 Tax=Promethearchaeum syntrophicum TaxID=2594042 RepID=A0A5B9D5Z9_9ARCH|nr:cupin domain-containing protein [Candidatus Prometheoarchaeum syntrophicum]QEE14250.1 3-hydroxyanthranilate 3,4-dioxygenase [Candidatus Prometheoarchaeum syntrophicum]
MLSQINLEEKILEIDGKPWTPVEVVKLNNQVVRMAFCHGEYHWHKHTLEDEMFLAYRGQVTIQLRNQPDVILKEGEVLVVPKAVEHCPKSKNGCYVLVFEPMKTISIGD